MPIADWFRKAPWSRGQVAIDLASLEAALADAVPRLEGRAVEPALVRARLADGYRDGQVEPLPPTAFDARTAGLDAEAWRRLALAVSAVDLPPIRTALPKLLGEAGVARQVEEAFIGLAQATPLLMMELLRQSRLRVEEFARHFLARLGAEVVGETRQQSHERLERLDYGQLLAEADRARLSAEERLEHLRKLQDEQDQRRGQRGKW
jgi:hypothetical protein